MSFIVYGRGNWKFSTVPYKTVCTHWTYLQFCSTIFPLSNLALYLPAGREASDDPRSQAPYLILLYIVWRILKSSHFGRNTPPATYMLLLNIATISYRADFFSREIFRFGRYSIFHARFKTFKFSHVFRDRGAAEQQNRAKFECLNSGMNNWISAKTKLFFWN